MIQGKPEPFLKWVGGKRRLIPKTVHRFPKTYGRWVEPFIGGAGLLLHFLPERPFISDSHEDLINTYRQLRDDFESVVHYLEAYKAEHSAENFYRVRDLFNQFRRPSSRRAAMFIYLNCKCFNGLCRYNSTGGFNAPLHKISHLTRKIPHREELREVSRYLSRCEITCCDFRRIPTPLEPGDFVVLDPPYWPYWEEGFTTYTGNQFIEKDQYDLLKMVDSLTHYGVMVMLWNSDVPKVRELYSHYDIASVSVKNCVGQKSYEGKKPYRAEVCVINYDPETGQVRSL